MKTTSTQTVRKITAGLAALVAAIATLQSAKAANIIKADTVDNLDQGAAWVGGVPPTSADVAVFDSTLALNNLFSLGVDTNWLGLSVLNPSVGPVTINAGGTLGLGASGVDMTSATTNLIFNNVVLLNADQTWNVASGFAITNTSILTGGSVLVKRGAGTLTVSSINNNLSNAVFLAEGTTVTAAAGSAHLGTGAVTITNGALLVLFSGNSGDPGGGGDNFTNTMNVPVGHTANVNSHWRGGWTGPLIGGGTLNLRVNGTRGEINTANNWSAFTGQINMTPNGVGADPVMNNGSGAMSFGTAAINFGAGVTLHQRGNYGAAGQVVTIGEVTGSGTLAGQQGSATARVLTWAVGGRNTDATFNGLIRNGDSRPTAIRKEGTGSWTLTGNHTFNSSNMVVAGKLVGVTGGSISNSVYGLVSTNATYGVLLSSLAPRWVSTNLIFQAGGILEFNMAGNTPSTTEAPLLNRGNLTFTTTNAVFVKGGNWAVAQYPLVKYTGTLANFAALTLAGLPNRVEGYLSNNTANTSIDLVVTNTTQPLRWATGNATWDTATANWVDAAAAAATYAEAGGFGDAVVFEDAVSVGNPLTITLNSAVTPASVTVNATKTYSLSGSGGINGFGSLTKSGSGILNLATANGFTGGANLNGGVTVFSALNNLGASSSPITFGGGVLSYAPGNTADISASRTVTFAAGGGTIDVFNNNVTYSAAIGNNGAGGLTKGGTGSLTLSGANRYSGVTTINSGTLALASGASISNSTSIVVGSGNLFDVSASGIVLNGAIGQTLTGSGTVNGTVTSGAGSFLAPGTSPGTLTISNVTMSGGTYVYDVSTNSGRDLIIVNGNLTLTSGTVQVNVSGSLTNGRYTLFQYTGALTGAAGNLVVIGFSQVGKLASLSSSIAGQIDLVISTAGGANITWAGVGADWDVETSFNWNAGAAQYVNGDFVTFNDSGSGVQSVNLASSLLPGGVTVNSTAGTADYSFSSGAGGLLSGSAALTKSGSSTLTVLTADNRTGATTISGGTVQVGNGSTTGDLGSGNITNNSALVFQQTDNRTVIGAVRGTGTLAQNGATTLTLSGPTEYTGATAVGSGATLQVGNGGANGVLSTSGITDDGRLILNSSTSWTNSAAISGLGELVKQGTGTLTLNASNSYAGNTYVSNGVVKIAASERVPSGDGISGWLILDAGATVAGTFDLNGFNETVNGLQGLGGTVQGRVINSVVGTTNVLTVSNEVATAYAGLIQDNNGTGGTVTLVKQGSAQLSLTGLNGYSGGTIIKQGTLAVGSNGQVGTGGIIMSNGTTFNMSANTPSVFPGNTITIEAGGTGAFASANAANGIGGNILSGDANSTNSIVGPISIGSGTVKQYQNFTGTVQVEAVGSIRFSATGLNINGGDNTTFVNLGTINTRNGSAGANNGIYLGALFGNGILSSGGAGAGGSTYIIGTKNIDCTFSGQVTDVNAATNVTIIKAGTGTLTLDGSVAYHGATTVSNGVLNIAGGANLDNSSSIAIRSGAKLDVSTAGVLNLGNVAAQSLGGSGTVWGSVAASGASVATINPGDSIGTLTITNDLTLALNTVVNMELNRTNAQTADRINAATYTGGGATVNVTNLGPTLLTGDTFQLFGSAVTGLGTISLPVSNIDNTIGYTWTNMIAIDGSIKVLIGASPVNPNPTNITSVVSGNQLQLSWPASHIGWTLQAQTNSLATGINTNWVNVTGSTTTNQVFININPANGAVFYRMKL